MEPRARARSEGDDVSGAKRKPACVQCGEPSETVCDSCSKIICYGCTDSLCEDANICTECRALLVAEARENAMSNQQSSLKSPLNRAPLTVRCDVDCADLLTQIGNHIGFQCVIELLEAEWWLREPDAPTRKRKVAARRRKQP